MQSYCLVIAQIFDLIGETYQKRYMGLIWHDSLEIQRPVAIMKMKDIREIVLLGIDINYLVPHFAFIRCCALMCNKPVSQL